MTFSSWTGFTGNAINDIPLGTRGRHAVAAARACESPVEPRRQPRHAAAGARHRARRPAATRSGSRATTTAGCCSRRSADPAGRVPIARVDVWTTPEAFDTYASQKSAPVNLVAGQQYYIEAFSKEGNGGDNLSVAWSGPGLARQVISGDFLAPTTAGCAGWCP